jgi:hypothetical protein
VDDQSKSAAKLAVHLLKQPQQQQQAAVRQQEQQTASAAAAAASSLERVLSLGLGAPGAGSGVEVQGIVASRREDSLGGGAAAGVTPPPAAAAAAAAGLAAGSGVAMSPSVAGAADALDALVSLLEQYCHPSNSGSWSGELAVFLRHGVHYFMKVGWGVLGGTVCW